jgi:hypothetical protein
LRHALECLVLLHKVLELEGGCGVGIHDSVRVIHQGSFMPKLVIVSILTLSKNHRKSRVFVINDTEIDLKVGKGSLNK